MLSIDALNSAVPLTERLDSAKLFVTPIEGTPLAAMVAATRSDQNFTQLVDGQYQIDIASIDYIANAKDPVLGFSPHDRVADEIGEVTIKAVQGHIRQARTVVAPAVDELVTKTVATMAEIDASSLLGMEVCVWNPPKPLENSSFETSVRKFDETPIDCPPLKMRCPNLSVEEIRKLMETGSRSVDDDIAEWSAALGDTFFINLWENVFQIKQADLNSPALPSFRHYLDHPVSGYDNTLAIYLIARRLADETMPGIEMPLREFEQLVADFRNQAGSKLVRIIEENDRAVKDGRLVISTTERCTTVHGRVYRDWIEKGGENEILFGNLLDRPVLTHVGPINDKAEALKAGWNRYAALTATLDANRRFNRTKEVLAKHFQDQLAASEELDVVYRIEVMKVFREQLDQVREGDLKDLYALCLRLVCRSRFAHTDAERILEGIERVKRDNPSIDVREAAAVSVLEYVAYWVSSQFKVTAR